jgi:hypothetical protein
MEAARATIYSRTTVNATPRVHPFLMVYLFADSVYDSLPKHWFLFDLPCAFGRIRAALACEANHPYYSLVPDWC